MKVVAQFHKSHKQVDEYFTPQHRNFLAPVFPFEWLSLRKRGDKILLNYKHYFPENVEVHDYCDELEIEIQQPEKLKKTFTALNFRSLVIVKKARETYIYQDQFEIALDQVKSLGYFIEIEALKDFGGVKETKKELLRLAKRFGLDHTRADKRGYPYLMLRQRGLVK